MAAPIENKVKSATAVTFLVSLLIAVLNSFVADSRRVRVRALYPAVCPL
jgi:hypothetical protein